VCVKPGIYINFRMLFGYVPVPLSGTNYLVGVKLQSRDHNVADMDMAWQVWL